MVGAIDAGLVDRVAYLVQEPESFVEVAEIPLSGSASQMADSRLLAEGDEDELTGARSPNRARPQTHRWIGTWVWTRVIMRSRFDS